ncbi:MAG: MATE family efflux transporter [Desulfuromonas sp.]|nr:MAG: MATE family efflux transporter [Desulfuromonas sp.]
MNVYSSRRWLRLRTEMKSLTSLTGPILAAQLAHASMGFVDTVMAGRYSPLDLAAVAIGSSVWFPLFLFMLGVLLAVTPSVSQLHGQNESEKIGAHVRQALLVAVMLAIPIAMILPFCEPLLHWIEVDPPAIPLTVGYLKGVSLGVPAVACFFVLRHYSEGLGYTGPSMLAGFIGLGFNISANYVLIFGKLGFPALGGIGCGYATGLTMWVMALSMLAIVLLRSVYRPTKLFAHWPRPDYHEIATILRLGLPIGFSLFVESSIFAVIALLIGSLGAQIVAAHQISLNVASLIFMIPLSFSHAITVRVGWGIGRNDLRQARYTSYAGIGLTFAIAIVTAALTLLFPDVIAAIYTDDHELLGMTVQLLTLAALFQVSDAVQVCASGALRGYKDTRVPMQLLIIAYWVIGFPLGYTLALTDLWRPAMGAAGFWIGLIVGLTVAAFLLSMRLHRLSRRQHA